MNVQGTISGSIGVSAGITGSLSPPATLSGSLKIGAGSVEVYDGEYEITPGEDAQTICINGKQAADNIIINPIPNNYGLITYNGVSITVS